MIITLQDRGRAFLRRMLGVDKPVPVRSEAEVDAEALVNYRWNFAVNVADGALFWFSLSFISSTTILPLFVSKLTLNPLWIALLAVLSQSAWYLPQLFVASPTEQLARKKPIVINLGFFTERLPLFLLPISALLSLSHPTLALLLFFIGYAWHGLGAGAIAPAWSDMIASCFPVDRRGWFFGLNSFIGTGLGVLGAIFSSWLLVAYPYPLNFALTFLLAAIAITLSWAFLALTREPVRHVSAEAKRAARSPLGKVNAILRVDRNFRQLLWSRLLSNIGRMGAGFLTVSAIERWGVADSTVGIYTAAMLLGQTGGNLLAGVVADRRGHKLTLEIGQVIAVLAFTLAWYAPQPAWYYVIFFLMGAGQGVVIVSGVLVVMEFSQPAHRPTYVGLGNTVSGVGSVIAPLIGGLLAAFSYDWLFACSALVSALALIVLLVSVREPRNTQEFPEIVV